MKGLGNCCCVPCVIAFDNFLYTGDPADLGWQVVSGDWNMTGSGVTAGSDAMMIYDIASDTYNMVVQVNVVGSTPGDEIKVILNYQDSDNYCYVQFTMLYNGCIEIHQVQSGTDTMLQKIGMDFSSSSFDGTKVFLIVDFANTAAHGPYMLTNITGSSTIVGLPLMEMGYSFGLGTGTVASTVTFQKFSAGFRYDPDTHTTCPDDSPAACFSHSFGLGLSFAEQLCEWEMSGGGFTDATGAVPSGAGAMMLSNWVNPYETAAATLTCNVQLDVGDEADIIFGYQDSSNYVFMNLEGTNWFAKLYSVSDGTSTLLNQWLVPYSTSGGIKSANMFIDWNSDYIQTGGFSGPLTTPVARCQFGLRCPSAPSATWKSTSYSWGSRRFFIGDTFSASCGYFVNPPTFGNYLNGGYVSGCPEKATAKVTFSGCTGASAAINGTTFELPRISAGLWASGPSPNPTADGWLPFISGSYNIVIGFNISGWNGQAAVMIAPQDFCCVGYLWSTSSNSPCPFTTYGLNSVPTLLGGNRRAGGGGDFDSCTISLDFT